MGWLRVVFSSLVAGVMGSVGLACAVAAVIAQGGRSQPRLDILSHFAPFWLAGAVVVTLYALWLAPRGLRTSFLTLGGAGITAAAALIVPELLRPMSPRAPTDAPGQIKLIQFNVWGRNGDVEATARWIVDQNPDVVVMEEANPVMRDAMLRLAPYHVVCERCSVMIFSKTEAGATEVPSSLTGQPRPTLARATFRDAHGAYTVLGAHYTWPVFGGLQQAQGRMVAGVLNRLPKDRLILAGDFNSTPWSFSRRREDAMFGLERRTKALFSWPAGEVSRHRIKVPFPFLAIDHVYAGKAWRTVSVRRGPRLGSDHYPVVVVLAPAV